MQLFKWFKKSDYIPVEPVPTHYNRHTGDPCACLYGKPTKNWRLASFTKEAGPNWNRFKRETGKKFFKNPEAANFIDAMDQHLEENPEHDNLSNFLVKEFKADRVYPIIRNSGKAQLSDENGNLHSNGWGSPSRLEKLSRWERARQSPHRMGANLLDPEFTINQALAKASEHDRWTEERERKARAREQMQQSEAPVVHSWPDGWTVRNLAAAPDHEAEMELEGEVMNHCIGSDEQPSYECNYKNAVSDGQISHAYSLRDPSGFPKATFHMNADHHHSPGLAEIHGYGDHRHELLPHVPKVVDFLEQHHPNALMSDYAQHSPDEMKDGSYDPFDRQGSEYDGDGNGPFEERTLYAPVPSTLEEYHHYNGQGDGPEEYMGYEDQDYINEYVDRFGEYPDIERREPDMEAIAHDFVHGGSIDHDGENSFVSHGNALQGLNDLADHDKLAELEAYIADWHDNLLAANGYKDYDYELLDHHDEHGNQQLQFFPGTEKYDHQIPNEEIHAHKNALHILDRYKDERGNHVPTAWVSGRGTVPYKDSLELHPKWNSQSPSKLFQETLPSQKQEGKGDWAYPHEIPTQRFGPVQRYLPPEDILTQKAFEQRNTAKIKESKRRFAQKGYDRTFWYDDESNTLYLSGVGNSHANLMDEFGEDLGYQGRYSGTTVSWYGMEGFIPLEAQQRVAHAISERFSVHIKTADKFNDFLRNPKSRPDLQTPEAQDLLNTLEKYHSSKTDKMMPWLVREWKKGRLLHRGNVRAIGYQTSTTPPVITPERLEHWADWLDSKHPEAKGDLMRHKIHEVAEQHVPDWDEQMKAEAHQKALEGGDTIHHFDNGWTLRNLTKPDELRAEGDAMGHCVGGEGYANDVARGGTVIHSLRDEKNRPHATLEYEPVAHEPRDPDWIYNYVPKHPVAKHLPEEDAKALFDYHEHMKTRVPGEGQRIPEFGNGRFNVQGLYNQLDREHKREVGLGKPKLDNAIIKQIQGKGNEVLKPEYQKLLKSYFQTMPEETRPNWDQQAGPINSIEEFAHHHDLDFDYVGDNDGYGYDMGGYGAHGDYGLHTPDRQHVWGPIVDGLLRPGWNYKDRDYDPEEGRILYEHAKERGEIPQFANAVNELSEDAMGRFNDHFDYMSDGMYHMYPGEEFDPEEHESPEAFAEQKAGYDDEVNEMINNHPPSVAAGHLVSLIQPHYNGATQQYENDPIPPPPSIPPVQPPKWSQVLKPIELEPIPELKVAALAPEPVIEYKVVEPNTEVIDSLQEKVLSLSETIAKMTSEASATKPPERKRLVILRDEEGRISSIEEA